MEGIRMEGLTDKVRVAADKLRRAADEESARLCSQFPQIGEIRDDRADALADMAEVIAAVVAKIEGRQ